MGKQCFSPMKSKARTAHKSTGKINNLVSSHRPVSTINSRSVITRSLSCNALAKNKGASDYALLDAKCGRASAHVMRNSIFVSQSAWKSVSVRTANLPCDKPPTRPRRLLDAEDLEQITTNSAKNEDSPPTKPRRLPSAPRGAMTIDQLSYSEDSISNQRNAVFAGGTPKVKSSLQSSFWSDLRARSTSFVDKPPSHSRQINVSALESFAAIDLKGSSPSLNNMMTKRSSTSSGRSQHSSAWSSTTTSLLNNFNNKPAVHPASYEKAGQYSGGSQPKFVEIAPGQQAKVRDIHETWSSIQRDFYLPVSCSRCLAELTCIKDVDNVLCSSCGVVSQVGTNTYADRSRPRGGGLGLGLTTQDLRRCEMEGVHPTS